MWICPKCGAKNTNNYCIRCGAPSTYNSPDSGYNTYRQPSKNNNSNTILIILIAVICILAITIIVIAVTNNNKADDYVSEGESVSDIINDFNEEDDSDTPMQSESDAPSSQSVQEAQSAPCNIENYTKYFGHDLEYISADYPNLAEDGSLGGSIFYTNDGVTSFGIAFSNNKCCTIITEITNLYPEITSIVDSDGLISVETFQNYIGLPVEYSSYETGGEEPLFLFYYGTTLVTVDCSLDDIHRINPYKATTYLIDKSAEF